MAQRKQFDSQNQIFLKIWQKPYSFAMKTGMKLNISSVRKEVVQELLGHSFLQEHGHLCLRTVCGHALRGLGSLGSGLELSGGQSAPTTA